MHNRQIPKSPSTPLMRRFLRDLFKGPTITLGKRRTRDADQENEPPAACVALQNEDSDADVVVISALHGVPFCYHADLLTMARPALLDTAATLNAALPRALRIATEGCTDASIRASIECLVGIRPAADAAPRAPKRARARSVDSPGAEGTSGTILPPSPVSPLVARSRAGVPASAGSRSMLASLREASDEDSDGGAPRPSKRRRTAHDPSLDGTPTRSPLGRARARTSGTGPSEGVRAPAPRLGRSQSHRLPPRDAHFSALHRNVTASRPGRARARSAALTSTPRARHWVTRADHVAEAAGHGEDDSFSSPASGVSAATTASRESAERVERVSGWLESSVVQEVDGVAANLEGLSLGLSAGDSGCSMDVSF